MVSALTIPELKTRSTNKTKLSPNQTYRWLSELASLDTQDSLNQLFETLHESNRVVCKPELRLEVLELYREPISLLAEPIERVLSESSTPLPGNHAQLADLMKRVVIEMTYGYKSIVLDLAKTRRPNKLNDELCTVIHRSIRYLYLTLLQCALYYNSYPVGTWTELHSLFAYARKLDIQNESVRDTLNTSRPKNNITHAYQQALLFGLSDPYRHPVSVIGKIHRYLNFWASDTHVCTFAKPPTTRCQFIIDPKQDKPAQSYAGNSTSKKTKGFMLLDTRGITKTAHKQWRDLDLGTHLEPSGLPEGFFDHNGVDMLQRVISAWGIAPRRKYPRNAISGTYQLVVGVNASHYFINGCRSLKCVSNNQPTQQWETSNSTSGLRQTANHDGDYVKQNWQGENESSHGLCLYVDLSKPAAIQVCVGEVIAFRLKRDQASWSAGLVRWVRLTESKLRVGLQKLGSSAQAIAVKPVHANNANAQLFEEGILIPQHERTEYANSLVTRAGVYEEQRELLVDDGKVTGTVRTKKLLERSRYYEWFGYELAR